MADGQMPLQTRELALVEDGSHQAHVLDHGDRVTVADCHAGRLLAPVLQREKSIEGEVGYLAPGGVDTEDTAGFLHGVPILAQGRVVTNPPAGAPDSLRGPQST